MWVSPVGEGAETYEGAQELQYVAGDGVGRHSFSIHRPGADPEKTHRARGAPLTFARPAASVLPSPAAKVPRRPDAPDRPAGTGAATLGRVAGKRSPRIATQRGSP